MAGAAFFNCATFSASDIRRIKSSARSLMECDGSCQMGGSVISGTRAAAAEKASASSEALNETTDAPVASFISTVLNLAVPLLATKEIFSGPRKASSSCSTVPLIVATFRAPVCRGKNIEVFRQDIVTDGHVKHPFTGTTGYCVRRANRDGILAGRQL